MLTDLPRILSWYLTCLALSVSVLPLLTVFFRDFKDFGYIFTKPLGLLLSGGLIWALSVFHICRFSSTACMLAPVVVLIISLLVFLIRLRISHQTIRSYCKTFAWKRFFVTALIYEAVFFVLFLYFCYLKGNMPQAYGTERFMDFGLVKSLLRSDYMPGPDIWYSGETINYYYVGQFLAAYMCRLSKNGAAFGYNLMLMTLPTLLSLESFSVVYNLLSQVKPDAAKKTAGENLNADASAEVNADNNTVKAEKKKLHIHKAPIFCIIGGILAALANTFAGNMHYVIYGLFQLAGKPDGKPYYFPDSTRFIGYNPDVADKTIHEFPAYSFVLGDLHAHVVNTIFVLTLLALLLSWFLKRKELFRLGKTTGADAPSITIKHLIAEAFSLEAVLIGIMLGLFHGINYWDFAIYYIVTGAVILFSNVMMYRKKKPVILGTLFEAISIMGMAKLCALPFTLHFHMISSHIRLSYQHTPIWQFMILWGLPILTLLLLCYCVTDKKGGNKEQHPDLFILILALCGFGLLIGPEILYIDDIYSGPYERTNTMFKLVFQAWILFGLCMSYTFVRILCFSKTRLYRILTVIPLICFLLTTDYFRSACTDQFGGVWDLAYDTLNATAFMKYQYIDDECEYEMRDDLLAINWLNKNVREYPTVILEASGESYSFYERISVFTGQPTVLGWPTHEWLWRADNNDPETRPAEHEAREEDIKTIYTGTDESVTKDLIRKYNISYIVIGYNELNKTQQTEVWEAPVNTELLKSLGEVVFTSDHNKDCPLSIIDVRNISKQ